MKTSPTKKNRGASILLLSFFFMTVLFLLAATLYKLVPAEMHAAYRSNVDLQAHYVARAGVNETMAWLNQKVEDFQASNNEQDLPDYSTDGTTFPNIDTFLANLNTAALDDQNWTYTVEILPHQNTQGTRNNSEVRFYSVSATASHRGKPIKEVNVLLRQKTFALFAFFTDQQDPNSSITVNGTGGINGPAHTNDYWTFDVEPSVWNDPNAQPYFSSTVGYAGGFAGAPSFSQGDLSNWNGNAPYDSNGPIAGRYEKVFAGGKDDLRAKNSITLPTSSVSVRQQAWPDSATLPTSNGVFLAENASGVMEGGVFVSGDVREVRLGLDEFGNQETFIKQFRANGTQNRDVWGWRSYSPKRYYNQTYCTRYENTGSGSGGSGGGVGGGSLGTNRRCVAWGTRVRESRERYLRRTDTVTDYDEFQTRVIEVTEQPRDYIDENGDPQTAQVGQTVLVDSVKDNNNSTPQVIATKVVDGQPNGAIYVDGDIGRENKRYNQDQGGYGGLWGITKGSAKTDVNGDFVLNSLGEKQYVNKTVATNLDSSISLGGDLLQFDPDRFATNGAGLQRDNHPSWANVARDPDLGELSMTNEHALGIWTEDIWMKGPKNSNARNNYDNKNDVYAIMLAGKTEVDSNGLPRLDSNGRPITSGGFGTWREDRDRSSDGTGRFRIFGGIIQATTGKNYQDSNNDTHYWHTEGIGYDVQELNYDIEATRIPLFPPLSEFAIVRYLEKSARGR